MTEPQGIEDEEHKQVLGRVAAVDVSAAVDRVGGIDEEHRVVHLA